MASQLYAPSARHLLQGISMNKLAPLFTATVLVLSGVAFAEDKSTATPPDPSARPDAAQLTKPRGFMLIQRNIYVPVDAEGKMAASENWVVIDKQGFITTEDIEAAQRAQGSGDGDESGIEQSESKTPSMHKPNPIGEGPTILS